MHEDTGRGNKAHWVPHTGRAEPQTDHIGSMIRFIYRVYWGILPQRTAVLCDRSPSTLTPPLSVHNTSSEHTCPRLAITLVLNRSLLVISPYSASSRSLHGIRRLSSLLLSCVPRYFNYKYLVVCTFLATIKYCLVSYLFSALEWFQ